jgi:dihydroneopterin aldolase
MNLKTTPTLGSAALSASADADAAAPAPAPAGARVGAALAQATPAALAAQAALSECTRLALRGLAIDVSIGVFEHEKRGVQPVRVTVEAWVPTEYCTPAHDRLTEVIDYGRLRQIAIDTLTDTHIHLLESACERIAAGVLGALPVRCVRVAIDKPQAFADVEAVTVEITRWSAPR